jgi:hypothetical protein
LIYQKQTNMQLTLTKEEILKVLFTCFCDGGLKLLTYCGIELDFDNNDYFAAMDALANPCLEDVYIQMIRENRRVVFIDTENKNEETVLTLDKAIENFQSPEIYEDVILLVSEGNYDAISCYRVLQFALYGEVVYG